MSYNTKPKDFLGRRKKYSWAYETPFKSSPYKMPSWYPKKWYTEEELREIVAAKFRFSEQEYRIYSHVEAIKVAPDKLHCTIFPSNLKLIHQIDYTSISDLKLVCTLELKPDTTLRYAGENTENPFKLL